MALDEHIELTGSVSGDPGVLDVGVSLRVDDGLWVIRVEYEDGEVFRSESQIDAEELLVELRDQLDTAGRRLHCNRYRKNALVSGMSRGMSDGLQCYLVKPWMPIVHGRHMGASLDLAPARDVVSKKEADVYIRRWIRRSGAVPFAPQICSWLFDLPDRFAEVRQRRS